MEQTFNKMNWPQDVVDRFWNKVRFPENVDDCWEWTAYKNRSGYGVFIINNKTFSTHRLSWMFYNGPIDADKLVCHKCDNRSCVNPNHLFIGTYKDNTQDMINKNRQKPPLGQKNAFSTLLNSQVIEILNNVINGKYNSVSEISDHYNVGLDCIYQIFKEINWKHITKDYNMVDLRKKIINENCAPYKLTINDVIQIKHRLLNNDSAINIGKDFGVSQQSILAIKNQETWSHIDASLTKQQLDQIKNARNRNYKLTEEDVRNIRLRAENSESIQSIANSYGVHKTTINRIINGTIWSYVI